MLLPAVDRIHLTETHTGRGKDLGSLWKVHADDVRHRHQCRAGTDDELDGSVRLQDRPRRWILPYDSAAGEGVARSLAFQARAKTELCQRTSRLRLRQLEHAGQ